MSGRAAALLVLALLASSLAAAAGGRGYAWTSSVEMIVPAVARTETGFTGVTSRLYVTIAWPGSGTVYVSADPLAELDMQAAARVAAMTAALLAGYEFDKFDYFVRVEADSPIVGGPSASAAMAVAFLAAFRGETIPGNFSMTGMIDPDLTVGPVGGVPEKLTAVAEAGVRLFAVPAGQLVARDPNTGAQVDLEQLGRQLGVKVVEVYTVVDAYTLATGDRGLEERLARAPQWSYPGWLRSGLKETITFFAKAAEGNLTCAREAVNTLPASLAEQVQPLIEDAAAAYRAGEALKREGLLYSAASRYFYSAIVSTEACILAKALASEDPVAYALGALKPYQDAAQRLYGYTETLLRGTLANKERVTDVELQLAVAVLLRVNGAREALDQARSLAQAAQREPLGFQDLVNLVSSSVYAYYRSVTAKQWLDTMKAAGGIGKPVAADRLRKAVENYLYAAYTFTTYSRALGVASPEAEANIEKARIILGNATSLLDYIDALVYAVNGYTEGVTRLRGFFNTGEAGVNATARALAILANLDRAYGYEPILPMLYLEYANHLPDLGARLGILIQGASYGLLLGLLGEKETSPPAASARTETTTTTIVVTVTQPGGGKQTRTVAVTYTHTPITVTKTETVTVTEKSVTTVTRLKEAPLNGGAYAAVFAAGLVVGVALAMLAAARRP